MKRYKRAWARTAKYKRKDCFNWKPFSGYDYYCMSAAPACWDHHDRRSIERSNIRLLLLGHDEHILRWPARRWRRYVDYY